MGPVGDISASIASYTREVDRATGVPARPWATENLAGSGALIGFAIAGLGDFPTDWYWMKVLG